MSARVGSGGIAAAAALATLVCAALATGSPPPANGPAVAKRPLATCFWEGPISTRRPTTRGFDGRYFNFPEESATYWLARINLPEDAALELAGKYPHGRYMSLNAYSDGTPTDALSDVAIEPRPGATNPFVAGARRDRRKRWWRVAVVDQPPPPTGSARSPNTLYAQPAQGAAIELVYRVYEPDRGFGLAGGVNLPRPELRLADGTLLRDDAACAQINHPNREIVVQTVPEELWETARATPPCDPQTNPAYDPVRWERFFNADYASLAVISDCTFAGREERLAIEPELEGGFYSNRDSAYIYAHLAREFGPLLVIKGTLPSFPRTRRGPKRMPRDKQLRFWSLCTGESRVTTRTPDCLSDHQVLRRSGRDYTIVVSKPADRPANAVPECGVAWLDWGEGGDGVGDPDYALLIMRNMLVSPDFAEAIQRVDRPTREAEVMREHFPRSAYSTRAEFEARGC